MTVVFAIDTQLNTETQSQLKAQETQNNLAWCYSIIQIIMNIEILGSENIHISIISFLFHFNHLTISDVVTAWAMCRKWLLVDDIALLLVMQTT